MIQYNPILPLLTGGKLTFFTKVLAGITAILAWIFGAGALPLVYCYLGLCSIDLITGFIKAIINKEVESNKMSVGVGKKVLGLGVFALCRVLETVITFPVPIIQIAGTILILAEATSILENLKSCGVPVDKIINIIKEKE